MIMYGVTKSPDSICYCIHWLRRLPRTLEARENRDMKWGCGCWGGRGEQPQILVRWLPRRQRTIEIVHQHCAGGGRKGFENTLLLCSSRTLTKSAKGLKEKYVRDVIRVVAIHTVLWGSLISVVHSPLSCDYQRSRATCLILTYGSSSIELATTKQ